MVQALRHYVTLSLSELDEVRSALARDLDNVGLQRQIQEFECPTPDASDESRARLFPLGETYKIIARADDVEAAYREAMAEARESGNGAYLMPKLEAANESRRGIVREAQQAFERSDDYLPSLEQHLHTLNGLAEVSGRSQQAPASAPAPVGDAETQLQQLAVAIGDSTAAQVVRVAQQGDMSADERMAEIIRLDIRFKGKDSSDWATLLNVSSSAIRQTKTWKALQELSRPDH